MAYLSAAQHEEDKASEENLVREAWQKQLESEQLKVNPEEILEKKREQIQSVLKSRAYPYN